MVGGILKAIGGAFSGAGEQAKANASLSADAEPDNSAARAGLFNAMGAGLLNAKKIKNSDENTKKFSDERLKEIFENDDRVQYLAKINSYDFTYKPEAQKELGVDGNEHTGIIVQELEGNPAFKGCTDTDPESGFGVVNIPETTLANTAGLGDLARAIEDVSARLAKLENIIGDR